MSKSFSIGTGLIASLLFLTGCHAPPPPEPTPPMSHRAVPATQPAAVASPAQDPVIITDAQPEPGTAAALAQRAKSYAQSVRPLVTSHTISPGGTASEWPDPDSMQLTARASADETGTSPVNVRTPPDEPGRPVQASASVPHQAPPAPAVVPQTPAPAAAGPASEIARRARDYPADLLAQTDDELLRLVNGDSVPDLQSMAGLAPEDRELLSDLMDALSNFRNQLRQNSNLLLSRKVAPLIDLSDRLRNDAELSVPTVAIVRSAPAFGVYDPIDPARFTAGRQHVINIYYEVDNSTAVLNKEGRYETRLSDEVVLYTESSGLPALTVPKSHYTDISRRRRHDFFGIKTVTLPPTLIIGRYILKITVQDEQGRRIAENTLPVDIVAG